MYKRIFFVSRELSTPKPYLVNKINFSLPTFVFNERMKYATLKNQPCVFKNHVSHTVMVRFTMSKKQFCRKFFQLFEKNIFRDGQ